MDRVLSRWNPARSPRHQNGQSYSVVRWRLPALVAGDPLADHGSIQRRTRDVVLLTDQPASDGVAVVIGATGGLGRALVSALQQTGRFKVLAISRRSNPALDIEDENSVRL